MAKMTVPYVLILIAVTHCDAVILSKYRHSSYKVVMNYKTHTEANAFCLRLGGHTAYVQSDQEEIHLKNQLTAVQPPVMINVNVKGFHYKKTELNMNNQDFLLIEVKLPNDAMVVLSQYTHFVPSKSLMVIIGGWANTQSAIRKLPLHDVVVKHTPNILNPFANEFFYRRFWVSWKNGLIQAGRGWVLGANIIVEYKNPTPFTVRHLSLTTAGPAAGTIKIPTAINPESQIVTHVRGYHQHTTGVSLKGQEFLLFEVKISSEAYIGLSRYKNMDWSKMHQIIMGGWNNQKSAISTKSGGRYLHWDVFVKTPSIVSANEYRRFWVTWKHGFLRVGRGWVPGVDVFMQHKYPSPFDVRYVAFSSHGSLAGTFRVPTGSYGPITNTDRLFDIRYWTSNHCGGSSRYRPHCHYGGSSQCVVLAQSKRYKPKAVPCSDKAFTLCQFRGLSSE